MAGDPDGQALLGMIADETHADVFASLNDTGGTGNDWNLEYSTTPGTPMYVLLDEAKLGNFNEALSFPGTWPLSDPNQYNTYWGSVDRRRSGRHRRPRGGILDVLRHSRGDCLYRHADNASGSQRPPSL